MPCKWTYSIYDLYFALKMAGICIEQKLKPDPENHLSPMELQFALNEKKVTFGVTDRAARILHSKTYPFLSLFVFVYWALFLCLRTTTLHGVAEIPARRMLT